MTAGIAIVAYVLGVTWGFADPWADEIITAHIAMDASGLYNDSAAVLGRPATEIYDPAIGQQRAVTLISPAYNRNEVAGQTVVLTVSRGQFVKIGFDEPVEDDPRNPFGVDLIVFGNAFFQGSDFARPDTDFEGFFLFGTLFEEPITVAVSQSGIGDPQTNPAEWYIYAAGPFSDGFFPTNAFLWDRISQTLGAATDFSIPVDPGLGFDDFAGISAADAVELYLCSGGGTGFDLAESGFASIRFVYLSGNGGEVDALVDVFPALGDLDRDGDVDFADFGRFQSCFGAPYAVELRCECRSGDFDGDGLVTELDFGRLYGFLHGPSGE